MQEVDGADSRRCGLGRERNDDLARQGAVEQAAVDPGVARVVLELPPPVEIQPGLPDELRARMLRLGNDIDHD